MIEVPDRGFGIRSVTGMFRLGGLFMISKTVAISIVSFALAASANAATYTTRAAFDAATGGQTVIDYNGIAAPGGFVSYANGPVNFGPTTVTSDGTIFVIDPAFYGSSYAGGGFLNVDYAQDGTNTVVMNLGGSFNALGFDFGGLLGNPITLSFTLSNGETFTINSNNSIAGTNMLDFFGVTSAVGFSSVVFELPDANNFNALDNLTLAGLAAVPEPMTWAMLVLGFGAMGAAMRSQRRRLTFA